MCENHIFQNFCECLFCCDSKISDPRSDGLPLLHPPIFVVAIIAGYLYTVLSFGPRFMAKREPFKIKKILIVYNAFQIVANIFVWLYVRKYKLKKLLTKKAKCDLLANSVVLFLISGF